MSEQDIDRNHPATSYKLDQARRKGTVARSPDLSTVAVLAVAIVACHAIADPAVRQWVQLAPRWWSASAWSDLDLPRASSLLSSLVMACLNLLAPILIAIVLGVIASNLPQSGVVLSVEPIKPDFSRLNPAQGLKRLFSLKTLYLAAKSVEEGELFGICHALGACLARSSSDMVTQLK